MMGEKAQTSIEVLMILGLAVLGAITVGIFLKIFLVEQVAPDIDART